MIRLSRDSTKRQTKCRRHARSVLRHMRISAQLYSYLNTHTHRKWGQAKTQRPKFSYYACGFFFLVLCVSFGGCCSCVGGVGGGVGIRVAVALVPSETCSRCLPFGVEHGHEDEVEGVHQKAPSPGRRSRSRRARAASTTRWPW